MVCSEVENFQLLTFIFSSSAVTSAKRAEDSSGDRLFT